MTNNRDDCTVQGEIAKINTILQKLQVEIQEKEQQYATFLTEAAQPMDSNTRKNFIKKVQKTLQVAKNKHCYYLLPIQNKLERTLELMRQELNTLPTVDQLPESLKREWNNEIVYSKSQILAKMVKPTADELTHMSQYDFTKPPFSLNHVNQYVEGNADYVNAIYGENGISAKLQEVSDMIPDEIQEMRQRLAYMRENQGSRLNLDNPLSFTDFFDKSTLVIMAIVGIFFLIGLVDSLFGKKKQPPQYAQHRRGKSSAKYVSH